MEHSAHAVKGAVVLLSLQRIEHFRYKIVNICELKQGCRVTDRDRKVICDIVAKRCHGRIVIRSAPLAKQIGKAVDKHLGTRLLTVCENQLLACLFATAVVAIVATNASRLNGGGDHNGSEIAMLFQCPKKHFRKIHIALHKFLCALGAVDARQMKHKIAIRAIFVKQGGVCVKIVCVDLVK